MEIRLSRQTTTAEEKAPAAVVPMTAGDLWRRIGLDGCVYDARNIGVSHQFAGERKGVFYARQGTEKATDAGRIGCQGKGIANRIDQGTGGTHFPKQTTSGYLEVVSIYHVDQCA